MNILYGIYFIFLNSINLSKSTTPNVLIFLVDDLGYGDLGCYGNSTIDSPHIDSLARDGARYTQMYSAAPICTPSRAGFLTGRYPIRLGLTSNDNRFRTFNSPGQSGGLPHDETTVAQVAQELGYRTGLVGKWHLGLGRDGEHLPTRHGFHTFFGMPVTNVQTCGNKKVYNLIGGHGEILDRSFFSYWITLTGKIWLTIIVVALVTWLFYSRKLAFIILIICAIGFFVGMWYTLSFTLLSRSSCLLYRNETIIEQPVHLEDLTLRNTNEATRFMTETVQIHKKPFFLYMAYVKVHTALFTLPENVGRSRHGAYGDNIEELDWSVGKIIQTLKILNIENDTLIFFSSDNGPFLERGIEAGFCGRAMASSGKLSKPLRGAKGQTWECGIRVPGIVRWSGHVVSGQTIESISSLLDFYPSLLELWNVESMPDRPLDGVSLWSNLKFISNTIQVRKERKTLFHYCGSTIAAVRQGKYKAHYWTPTWDEGMRACPSVTICPCLSTEHSPPLLFDIEADPAEESPLDIENYADVLSMMNTAIQEHQATLVSVPNQLETLALPWLFPCCNSQGWTRMIRLITNSCQC
ncbi:unnamed protein product [Rotaria magnacalcarata]|uniref:Sulfatase N-terminal domain-containing protein n=1 Tax=Rotaria magnacalcarata TaxID=392030 RepID=A0A819EYW3_9BILA|nr:unnamed protein product [Rotaria magnacalcarata]CAF3859015.1 unnamed protein product [Rotaria magnacalcarata]